MRKDLTELVFILDRSGSMSGLEKDTIGGFNAMLERQKMGEGRAVVTTVLFDHEIDVLHDRIDIKGVAPMTDAEYFVRGNTALLDAIGYAIAKVGKVQKATAEPERAGRVLFVITTDGMENASREYTVEKVRAAIAARKAEGWEFLFLGANIDALETAESIGIAKERAANYHPDGVGTQLNYAAMNSAISEMRSAGKVAETWKEEIDRDYAVRSGHAHKRK